MQKTLVVYSGGLDSTVLLGLARDQGAVSALVFDYGQAHAKREIMAALEICGGMDISAETVNLDFAKKFKSGLLGGEIRTAADSVVPFRNGVMASIAAGLALSRGYGRIWMGCQGGDFAAYPDCRPQFVRAMKAAVEAGTGGEVTLEAPLGRMSKADVVRLGMKLEVPMSLTYSCYKGGEKHCGACPACLERKKAFAEAGVKDPTEYES